MNERKSGSKYIIVHDPNVAQIQDIIEYGVTNRMPVMCRLRFSIGGSWPYSTNGHYMNANGYVNYGEEICVTDPNIKRVNPSAGGGYWVHINELYYATHNHPAQEMSY